MELDRNNAYKAHMGAADISAGRKIFSFPYIDAVWKLFFGQEEIFSQQEFLVFPVFFWREMANVDNFLNSCPSGTPAILEGGVTLGNFGGPRNRGTSLPKPLLWARM